MFNWKNPCFRLKAKMHTGGKALTYLTARTRKVEPHSLSVTHTGKEPPSCHPKLKSKRTPLLILTLVGSQNFLQVRYSQGLNSSLLILWKTYTSVKQEVHESLPYHKREGLAMWPAMLNKRLGTKFCFQNNFKMSILWQGGRIVCF